MAEWIARVLQVLNSKGGTAVRRALNEAHITRTKVVLEISSRNHITVLNSAIEQLRDEDIVISQPNIGGLTHPLTFGEFVKIGFVQNGRYYSGESRCLGRVKIYASAAAMTDHSDSHGDEPVLHAYRLAYPSSLKVEDRREAPRVQFTLPRPVEARLYASATLEEPILGTLLDVSMTGAKFVTFHAQHQLETGQAVYLKAMLPEPAGRVDDLVTLTRVEHDPRSGICTIGLRFQRRIEGLEALLRIKARAA